jgi:hypothetical protein
MVALVYLLQYQVHQQLMVEVVEVVVLTLQVELVELVVEVMVALVMEQYPQLQELLILGVEEVDLVVVSQDLTQLTAVRESLS